VGVIEVSVGLVTVKLTGPAVPPALGVTTVTFLV